MAGDFLNILHGSVGEPQQILVDLQLVDAVDVETARENEVDGLPHLAGVAVFDGQHRRVALSVHHGVVGGLKIAVRHPIAVGENAACGDVGERPLHAAVRHREAALHTGLIGAGDRHHVLDVVDVIPFQHLVLHQRGVTGDHRLFAGGIEDR